jgi:NADPH-dependent 2,4-dienoyl-CoA reductase/sulfur reductase-like enzyme
MKRYDYLIAGGGMAAASAIGGIRELNREGSIALVSAESDPPYDRPPLSKGLWKGKPLEAIWMETGDAELMLGRSIAEIRPSSRCAIRDDGEALEYGRLLIATGGRARRFPFPSDEVLYLRDLADYRRLRARCQTAQRFLVVGGGFIAMEIAAALALAGKEVAMLFPEEGIAAQILPGELSRLLDELFLSKGVRLFPRESLGSLDRGAEGQQVAYASSGLKIEADAVVAGIGIQPNDELAGSAGIRLDDGIAVGPDLRTSDRDVFAAGDVASYWCGALRRRVRAEHEDNALAMGSAAGRSMAGETEDFDRIPYFYSELFELGFEAVGTPNPRGLTFIDWKVQGKEAVAYSIEDGRVSGVILWNVRKRAQAARDLIAAAAAAREDLPIRPEDLAGKL